ncbi:MAG TPA: hypothetical protein VF297_01470 [Pyrinomonadaceae bacterium]
MQQVPDRRPVFGGRELLFPPGNHLDGAAIHGTPDFSDGARRPAILFRHRNCDTTCGKLYSRARWKEAGMNFSIRPVALGTLALALLLSATVTVPGRQTGVERIIRERQRVMTTRRVEEGLRRPAERARREEEERLAFAQIEEDYVRIQVVNKELAEAVSTPGELDFKLVAKSTSEIGKRAERLLHNLALPELTADVERVKVPAKGQAQIQPSLLMLRRLVDRFVRSPLFREVNVIDAQVSTRARRDLEGIIELSERLKKECEELDKGSH